MSDSNYFIGEITGEITIEPPLTWSEIKRGPGLQDVSLRLHDEVEDSEFGRSTITTADAIVPLRHAYDGRWVARDVQAVIDAHPGHEFSGHIEMRIDPGYGDPAPRRFIVRDRRVEEVTARIVWDHEKPAPARMDAAAVAEILADMSERVAAGDSFDGSIEYFTDYESDGPEHVFEVSASYRVGNRMGQGGMRVIRGGGGAS